MLRVDVKAITNPPLNVQTEGEKEGTWAYYKPFEPGVPVTVYATGIRLGYDTLWHSGGHLYTAVNGSAAGGSAPPYRPGEDDAGTKYRSDLAARGPYRRAGRARGEGPRRPPRLRLPRREGRYFGHPNVRRGEFVLEGNPTAGVDHSEVPEYPVGTQPDRNWRCRP